MNPKNVPVGSSAKFPMVTLDLADAEQALALAKRMAEQTGRTVTVRDADGEVLGTFPPPAKN